ncbi:hypothetical protein ACFQX4_28605 [Roseomonas sp. GCM10028921]
MPSLNAQVAESLRAVLVQSLAEETRDGADATEQRAVLDQIGRRLGALLQHAPTPEGQTTEAVIQRARLAAQIEAALHTLHQQPRPS